MNTLPDGTTPEGLVPLSFSERVNLIRMPRVRYNISAAVACMGVQMNRWVLWTNYDICSRAEKDAGAMWVN